MCQTDSLRPGASAFHPESDGPAARVFRLGRGWPPPARTTWPDAPAAIRELDRLRPKVLGGYGWESWLDDVRNLGGQINQRRYQAEVPRLYRYTAGMLHAGLKTAGGTVEAIAHSDKIPGGVWNLATDTDTQVRAIKALVDRLSDPTADNWGELTAEIPLTVSGTAGAIKGTAKAVVFTGKLVVAAPRKTVELWRAMIRGGEDVALDVRPAGPESVRGATRAARAGGVGGSAGESPNIDRMLGGFFRRGDRRGLTENELDLFRHNVSTMTGETHGVIVVRADSPPVLRGLLDPSTDAAYMSPETVGGLIRQGHLPASFGGKGYILVRPNATIGQVAHEAVHLFDRHLRPEWYQLASSLQREESVLRTLLEDRFWRFLSADERRAQIRSAEVHLRRRSPVAESPGTIRAFEDAIREARRRVGEPTESQ